METNEVSAKGYFKEEYSALLIYLRLEVYDMYDSAHDKMVKDILNNTKEEFISKYPSYSESDYEKYKDFEETFEKQNLLSYVAFADLLNSKYGLFLNAIKESNKIKTYKNIRIIKNIMIAFLLIFIVGMIISTIFNIKVISSFNTGKADQSYSDYPEVEVEPLISPEPEASTASQK